MQPHEMLNMIDIEYPALLKESGPKVRAYPIETIFAEKVEAMVKLGMTNSRLKDYYDLIVLSETFELAGVVLTEAVCATFGRRETPLPSGLAAGLTDEFVTASEVRWKAFLSANDLRDMPPKLADAVARLRTFVSPVLEAAAKGKTVPERWIPPKGWT